MMQFCPGCRAELDDKSGPLPVLECPNCKARADVATGGHFVIERSPGYVRAAHPETGVEAVVLGPSEKESRLECVACGLTVEGYAAELQLQKFDCPPGVAVDG